MRQDSGIGVLDKAVGVLHAIAESPCGLADLCERTGLPRATAHRLAAGLEVHRLLARDTAGRWRLGPALSELSAGVADPLLAAGAAVLPGLREITGESVQLYRREGPPGSASSALEPPAGLRDTVPVGARLPMTAGSGARVLLAYSDPTPSGGAAFGGVHRTHAGRGRRRGWARARPSANPGWPASRRRCATVRARWSRRCRSPGRSTGWAGAPVTVGGRPAGRGRGSDERL